MESITTVGWIADIIDIVSFVLEAAGHIGIERIPPTGGDIDSCHGIFDCVTTKT